MLRETAEVARRGMGLRFSQRIHGDTPVPAQLLGSVFVVDAEDRFIGAGRALSNRNQPVAVQGGDGATPGPDDRPSLSPLRRGCAGTTASGVGACRTLYRQGRARRVC